ncbi:MAG TPA: hypothetical protein VGE47_14395 [Burkholderiaceae bacterium]
MRRLSFRSRRRLAGLVRVLRMLALVLLACAAWGSAIYVCGRQAQLITEEGARTLMRQVLPSIE